MEVGLTKNRILSELVKSPHGDLKEYLPIGKQAAVDEAHFLAHLIAWNHDKGQVRDSKVALPVIALMNPLLDAELKDNALAHIAMQNPRELLRTIHFAKDVLPFGKRELRRLARAYLREKERNLGRFDRMALQHRHAIKSLYGLLHLKPSSRTDRMIMKGGDYPANSLFDVVAKLKDMPIAEAAGTVMDKKIPFLIAAGALGKKLKEPDAVLALIKSMTATELVTNTKFLERLGIKTNPVLRAAYEEGLARVASSKRNVLKTTRAAETLQEGELKDKLEGAQKRQLANISVDGNWLVLADKSPSMVRAIEAAKEVAGTLTTLVKGKVWLVFFDSHPTTVDVTGCTPEQIKKATRHINTTGSGTSIGCGLARMQAEKAEIDGICIVSDGEENTAPFFHEAYAKFNEFAGKEVPVYFYHVEGSGEPLVRNMNTAGHTMQMFDLKGQKDFYSLPNLVQTMRTNPYSLIDEIMAIPLKKLADVLKVEEMGVNANA